MIEQIGSIFIECDKCGCYTDAVNGSCSNDCQGGLHGCDDEPNLWGQTDDNDYLECNSPTKYKKDKTGHVKCFGRY